MNQTADLLITNASVITANPEQPCAEAVAICGNQIVFAGSQEDSRAWHGVDTRHIDGQGNTLMPGFIDCHFHLMHGSLALATIPLGEVKTLEEFRQEVQTYAEKNPTKPWLEGHGLLYSVELPDNQPLSRHHLDNIIADRPLAVVAYDGHTAWANSLALEKAAILHGAETPAGSQVVIGEDGKATGELREPGAFDYVFDLIPKPDTAEKRRLVQQGLALAAKAGITSVHNMDGDYEQTALYADMERAGEMTLRVYMPFTVRPGMPVADLEEAKAMHQDFQGEFVRAGAAKFFMDGVLESYTALLTEEYATRPGFTGEAQYSLDEFIQLASECDRLGCQIFTHACGDGAVRQALDGYQSIIETNPPHPRRHRIEHIEVIHPTDLPRFVSLGVLASMQPLHSPLDLIQDPDPWPQRVGPQRYHRSFAWTSLREAGATLVFGSDWNVVSLNPMLGLHAALNRKPWAAGLPDFRQDLDKTIASYTSQAAYAEFQENRKGQIKPGLLADVVLLSTDLRTLPHQEVAHVRPIMTIFNGSIVYES